MARTYSGGLVSPKYPCYYGYFRNIKENLRNQPQTMDPLSQSVTAHLLKSQRRALYTNKQIIVVSVPGQKTDLNLLRQLKKVASTELTNLQI
jgi:hypothetical protein